MSPVISVVMPTYNGEKFIKEAIESVLFQSYSNFELIIVDDGSTDKTEEIIKMFEDKRIVYVKKANNSGISDSLNKGISIAKGDFIARMDDDDVNCRNRFFEQVHVLKNNKNIVLCGSNVYTKNKTRILKTPESHQDILMNLLFKNSIIHPSVMIRKTVLTINKYDSNFIPSEDYELWSRLIFEGEFYNIQKPLLFYRDHEKSETTTRRGEQLMKNFSISKFLLKKTGFKLDTNFYKNIKIIVSHKYNISGRELRALLNCIECLKDENKQFNAVKFNSMLDKNVNSYVLSYFKNTKILKKMISFLFLTPKYKSLIFKSYIK